VDCPSLDDNAAESLNHILKMKTDWCQLPLLSLIDNVHDVVKLQMVNLHAALTAKGDFSVASAFAKHTLPYHVWSVLTSERKDSLFQRFLNDRGLREAPKQMTSKDGAFTLPLVLLKSLEKSRDRVQRRQKNENENVGKSTLSYTVRH